ncbi:MAG: hypothetical protein LBO09_05925 [Candidatus Peribacteria bacterium]|jgi:hypothetical protein|nr:hypothetical protein [Candidatus Peribacteria bacterium]
MIEEIKLVDNPSSKYASQALEKELYQIFNEQWLFSGQDKYPLPLDTFVAENSSISVSPKRGLSIASLILNGINIAYSDIYIRNSDKSLREGFFMGPQAGPFTPEQNEKYRYNLQQHGFLRDEQREK